MVVVTGSDPSLIPSRQGGYRTMTTASNRVVSIAIRATLLLLDRGLPALMRPMWSLRRALGTSALLAVALTPFTSFARGGQVTIDVDKGSEATLSGFSDGEPFFRTRKDVDKDG